jgi:hypothetical protein
MALDVLLVASDSASNELVAELDDSGEYWFLAPFWPASSSNGNLIDLYGDASFAGANLKQLDGALARAAETVTRQPVEWDQAIGRKPDGTKLVKKVRRASLMALVERLRDAIAHAERQGGQIHFRGD